MDISLATTTSARVPLGATVLVPIGATEPHGALLPLDTATEIAVAVAEGAAQMLRRRRIDVVVAPALSYGTSGGHENCVGTVSIGGDVLASVIVELARSAARWSRRVVLVNAHLGNTSAVRAAVAQLVGEGLDVTWVACTDEAAELTVARTETSLMLHLRPWQVRRPGARALDAEEMRGASADEGREMLDGLAWFVARDVLLLEEAASR